MENKTLPQPAPPGAKSNAQPISSAELQRELAAPPVNVAPELKPEVKTAPSQEQSLTPENNKRPDFKSALREKMNNAQAEPETPAADDSKKPAKAPDEPKKKKEPAPKVEADKPTAKLEPDELPEDQRKILPHDKPDTVKRMKYFISEKEKALEEAKKLRSEIEELKKKPVTTANTEEIETLKKELAAKREEAAKFRRRYEIDSDPEFSSKFREPVKNAEKTISETLKRSGFSDATLKIIEDEGGFASFSRSRRTYPVTIEDPDNPGHKKTEHYSAAELAHSWLNRLPIADASAIRELTGVQERLRLEEKSAIQQAQEEATKFYESTYAAQKQSSEESQKAQEKAAAEYNDWLSKVEKETEFLKDREIPEGSADDVRKQIEEYNDFTKQLRSRMRKHPSTPQEYGALLLEAAESHHLRRALGDKDAKISKLEADLAKAKASMKTTPTGGSLMAKTNPVDVRPDRKSDPTDFRSGLRKSMLNATSSIDED